PDDLVEAAGAPVEMVRAVVGDELVRVPLERERALGDAVAVTADDGAEIRGRLQIAVEAVVAEDHVAQLARAVRHPQGDDDATVVDCATLADRGCAARRE